MAAKLLCFVSMLFPYRWGELFWKSSLSCNHTKKLDKLFDVWVEAVATPMGVDPLIALILGGLAHFENLALAFPGLPCSFPFG